MIARLFTSRSTQVMFLVLLLAGAVGVLFAGPPFVERLRQSSFDTYNRILPRKSDNGVVVIGIDTASIQQAGRGPLRRDSMTDMVTNLSRLGAKAIVFDRIFEYRVIRDAASQAPGLSKTVAEKDLSFENAIRQAGNVVLCFATEEKGYEQGARDPPAPKTGMTYGGATPDALARHFYASSRFQTSLPALSDAAAGNGFANFIPEKDAVLRRFPMMLSQADGDTVKGVHPALSLEAVRVALGRTGGQVPYGISGSARDGVDHVTVGPYTIPTDGHGVVRVYYAGRRGRAAYIPLAQVVWGQVDPSLVKDKIAIIGLMSPNMGDVRSSPLDPFMQGVEAHAEMIEQILQGQYLKRTEVMPVGEALWTAALSLAVIFLAQRINALLLGGLVAVMAGGGALLGLALFGRLGWLVDPLCPAIVSGVIFMLAALLAALRAAIVSQEKSRFLALMSHEIRTPMTGILGIIDFLKDDDLTPEEREDFINTISECSKTLLNTLNDILDVSKLEEGKLEISNINCDLHAVLNNCAGILDRMARNKGLDIRVAIDEDVPRQIHGDPHRLQQIVLNFMNNAIKFTAKGGVTVHCAFRDAPPRPFLRVEVTDTGIGISEKNMKKLFTSFSQADDSIARKYGGTGLGLSIARDLLLLMDGRVGVTSTPGEGSTFWFEIPYLPPVAAAAEEEENTEIAPLDILLAEDNKVTQQVAMRLLGNKGHKVSIADDGGTVVRMAQERNFDMILMDMNMPVKSGPDAAREIRALGGRHKDVPIIALTANVVEEYVRKCYDAGMNAHVAKPFSPKELYRTMARFAPAHAVTSQGPASQGPADPATEKLNANLREIAAQLGPAYLSEYIRNSLDESARLLKAAHAAHEAEDQAGLERAVHDLKNVSGMIGLEETALLATVVETLCRKNEPTALPHMLRALVRDGEREVRRMQRSRGLDQHEGHGGGTQVGSR